MAITILDFNITAQYGSQGAVQLNVSIRSHFDGPVTFTTTIPEAATADQLQQLTDLFDAIRQQAVDKQLAAFKADPAVDPKVSNPLGTKAATVIGQAVTP